MLREILEKASRWQIAPEIFERVLEATLLKQGGRIEIPFGDIVAITSGFALEVDRDNKMVILRAISDEEMEVEQAMAESKFQEKH